MIDKAKEMLFLDIEELKSMELGKIVNIVFDATLLVFAVIGNIWLANWVVAAPWPWFGLKIIGGMVVLAALPVIGFTTLAAIFDLAADYLDVKRRRKQLETLL